jgi:hypothetical protein
MAVARDFQQLKRNAFEAIICVFIAAQTAEVSHLRGLAVF